LERTFRREQKRIRKSGVSEEQKWEKLREATIRRRLMNDSQAAVGGEGPVVAE
jgi:hypothetical protein